MDEYTEYYVVQKSKPFTIKKGGAGINYGAQGIVHVIPRSIKFPANNYFVLSVPIEYNLVYDEETLNVSVQDALKQLYSQNPHYSLEDLRSELSSRLPHFGYGEIHIVAPSIDAVLQAL